MRRRRIYKYKPATDTDIGYNKKIQRGRIARTKRARIKTISITHKINLNGLRLGSQVNKDMIDAIRPARI